MTTTTTQPVSIQTKPTLELEVTVDLVKHLRKINLGELNYSKGWEEIDIVSDRLDLLNLDILDHIELLGYQECKRLELDLDALR